MKKAVLFITLLLGFNCSSQNFEVKKIIDKPLVNKTTDSSHINYILNLIENKTVSKFNENSFNLNSFFWSIKETFKKDDLDKIRVIQSVNFDIVEEESNQKKDSYVLQEWIFEDNVHAEKGFLVLKNLKEENLIHFPAPYNWKFFKYKNKIYFLYSFNLKQENERFKKVFLEIKRLAPFH